MRLQRYLLFEKKDHIIKRLKNLSQEEKDELIPLFKQNNPKLEGMIDWNNKNFTFNDFKPVLDFRSKTSVKKGVKKQGIKGLKPNKDYIELKGVSDIYNAYIPLSWEASKHIASANIGDCEGKWCTAYAKRKGYWKDYVERGGVVLVYLVGNNTKYAVALYTKDNKNYEMFDADDGSINKIPDFQDAKLRTPKMWKLYDDIQAKYFRKPSFVDEAETEDASYEVVRKNYIKWFNGTWNRGIWKDGVWEQGTWENGVWEHGIWEDGGWIKGTWKDGEWKDGEWDGGVWENGIWYNGRMYDADWENGMFVDGHWNNGIWKNGTFKSGIWFDGIFKDGTFEGTWRDGTFEGGIFNGGKWLGGEWIDGKWKSGVDKNGEMHYEGDSPDLWD